MRGISNKTHSCCYLSQFETVAFFACMLALLLSWMPCAQAAIPRETPTGEEVDFSAIKKVESVHDIRTTDVQEVIPTDMGPSNNQGQVGSKIIDYSFNNWLNSPQMKQTSLGRTASKVEKSMQANVNLGRTDSGVSHKVNFAMLPAQSKAQMKYSGLLDANLTYKVNNQELDFEMTRKLTAATMLVLNRTSSPYDGISERLSLRWTWP